MTKEATGSSFAPELLGGVPEAFVQTALLAGGIGLWEWQVVADRMALSPYLETLFGYPSGGFDGTKATFLARLKPIDKPRFELALANAIERGEEVDTEFQIFDVHGVNRCFVAKARVMSDSTGAAVRFVGTMQELPAAVITERRMRRQQAALLELVLNGRRATLSLGDALARITGMAGTTLDVERTSVWLFSDDRSHLICRSLYRRSLRRHMEGPNLDVAAFPAYILALEQNRALDASDAQSDPRTRELTENYLRPLGITSMLEATVRMDTGELVGVVCHEHVGPIRQWHLDEKSFAASIADMVTRALTDERQQAPHRRAHAERGTLPHVRIDLHRSDSRSRVRAAGGHRSPAGAAGGRGVGARRHRRMQSGSRADAGREFHGIAARAVDCQAAARRCGAAHRTEMGALGLSAQRGRVSGHRERRWIALGARLECRRDQGRPC